MSTTLVIEMIKEQIKISSKNMKRELVQVFTDVYNENKANVNCTSCECLTTNCTCNTDCQCDVVCQCEYN